jgi:uncharacterized transporter YbjL
LTSETNPVLMLARLLGAFLIGALLGLVPFFVARSRGQQGLGVAALLSSIFGGLILGILLAGPVTLVFTVVALVRRPPSSGGPGVSPGPGAGSAPPPPIG